MNEPVDGSAVFHAWGSAHVITLAIVVAFIAVLILVTRAGGERIARSLEIALAAVLFLCWPLNLLIYWHYGWLTASNLLPLQLCDAAAIFGFFALLKRWPLMCELLYFWGLAGTLQGLVTPALDVSWPHPRYIAFFLLHGGVVAAALQVVIGRGIVPRPGAVRRALGWLIVYGAVAGAADYLINHAFHDDVNYGFLCAKPPTASLIDALGPWPWYLVGLFAVAVVFFSLLNLPFVIRRRARRA
jgi:hypothetical integral membrane protein (TIGR02206 family)